MELRPPGSPVDDPFFAAIRRRHPDVDLVVLPPDPPAEDPLAPVDDADVVRAVELVGRAAAELWAAVAPLTQADPETRLRYADRESDVCVVAQVAEKRSDGYALLVRLRHELEERGWDVLRPPGPDGALERLAAERDGGRLVASYAEASGAVLLSISSAPLPVGVERARELVSGGDH
jgi:hypothetical protein